MQLTGRAWLARQAALTGLVSCSWAGPHSMEIRPPSTLHRAVPHGLLSVKSLIWVSKFGGVWELMRLSKNENKTATSPFLKDQMEFYFLASAGCTSPCNGLGWPHCSNSTMPACSCLRAFALAIPLDWHMFQAYDHEGHSHFYGFH